MIAAHSSRGRSWPMPGKVTSFAPGIAAAVAPPPTGRISGSASPCSTSVDTRTPANHVGGLSAKRVEYGHGIVRHVLEAVDRRLGWPPEHLQSAGHAGRREVRRHAGVAVVEPGHPEPALGERRAELVVPVEHLGS